MAKFLIQASHSPEGLQALIRDRPAGRREAVIRAVESAGGAVEAVYFSFGAYDIMVVADLPDNVAAAAVGYTVSASGLEKTTTTPLLTVEEAGRALDHTIDYRPTGG